jgi:hypothetical protein
MHPSNEGSKALRIAHALGNDGEERRPLRGRRDGQGLRPRRRLAEVRRSAPRIHARVENDQAEKDQEDAAGDDAPDEDRPNPGSNLESVVHGVAS